MTSACKEGKSQAASSSPAQPSDVPGSSHQSSATRARGSGKPDDTRRSLPRKAGQPNQTALADSKERQQIPFSYTNAKHSTQSFREQESAEGWREAAISGRRFWGTVSSGLGSQAFPALCFVTDLCTQQECVNEVTNRPALPARQGSKYTGEKTNKQKKHNLHVRSNRREKFTSPISSELKAHQPAECHLQQHKPDAMERQVRLSDCTRFTVSTQKGCLGITA